MSGFLKRFSDIVAYYLFQKCLLTIILTVLYFVFFPPYAIYCRITGKNKESLDGVSDYSGDAPEDYEKMS